MSDSDERIAADILIAMIGTNTESTNKLEKLAGDKLDRATQNVTAAYQTIFDAVHNARKQK
ncbi:hypothetical protein [Microbulbifer sp. JMSA003]|uniref:hypothetical protein n=1 Tax=unclassified Microbulbifer TaxID=2619833 RepID=UPI00403971B4